MIAGYQCFQGPGIMRVLVPSLFASFVAWQPACARCNRFQNQRMPSSLSPFFVEEYSSQWHRCGTTGRAK